MNSSPVETSVKITLANITSISQYKKSLVQCVEEPSGDCNFLVTKHWCHKLLHALSYIVLTLNYFLRGVSMFATSFFLSYIFPDWRLKTWAQTAPTCPSWWLLYPADQYLC
jgi:hypothetical protein